MSALSVRIIGRGAMGIFVQLSDQHVLNWVVRCWRYRASRHLVRPRRGAYSRPLSLFPVELEPEGLPMIKAVRLTRSPKNIGRIHSVWLRAAAGIASICLFPRLRYSQLDSPSLSCYPCRHELAGHVFLHRS